MGDSEPFLLRIHDRYEANCSGDLHRLSCVLSQEEIAKRDFIAALRLVFSLLSILGTVSIIISVIRRKQILNPKIHTIFMLSIADLILAIMWVIGGSMWINGGMDRGDHSRVGCFTVLLITVIVECVTINLTCVYALLAYSSIKQKDFSSIYSLFDKDVDRQVWKTRKIICAYVSSWVLPIILIMIPFSIVASEYHLVREANKCSCRCLPYFGNVLPMASPRDEDTANYLHHTSMLVASYGTVLVGNYLVGFVVLIIVYWKILRLIQIMKKNLVERQGQHKSYGITSNVLLQGQSRAKQRVVYFLTVFLGSGLFNLLLSMAHVVYQSWLLHQPPHDIVDLGKDTLPASVFAVYICQSITVPLQGFLNALVYGWTRSDFVHAVRSKSVNVQNEDNRLYKEQSSGYENASQHLLSQSTSERDSMPSRSWRGRDFLSDIPETDCDHFSPQ